MMGLIYNLGHSLRKHRKNYNVNDKQKAKSLKEGNRTATTFFVIAPRNDTDYDRAKKGNTSGKFKHDFILDQNRAIPSLSDSV